MSAACLWPWPSPHLTCVPSGHGGRLADFGLASFCGGPHGEHAKGEAGTISYIAPEVFVGARFNHAVDLWALGVCLFTVLAGYLPFDPTSTSAPQLVRKRILAAQPDYGAYPLQWKDVSAEARRLIGRLLDPEPATRITAKALLEEPWVAGKGSDKLLCCKRLNHYNEARRVWRMAADAIAVIVRAPHCSAAAAVAAALTPDDKKATPKSFSTSTTSIGRAGISGIVREGSASDGLEATQTADAAETAEAAETADAASTESGMKSGVAVAALLSEPAKRELQATFQQFDEDGSGSIDLEELRHAMRALGSSEGDAETVREASRVDLGPTRACAHAHAHGRGHAPRDLLSAL